MCVLFSGRLCSIKFTSGFIVGQLWLFLVSERICCFLRKIRTRSPFSWHLIFFSTFNKVTVFIAESADLQLFFFSHFVVHFSVCLVCKTCKSHKSEPWFYPVLAYQRSSAQGSHENSFLSHFILIILFEMSHTTMIRRNVSCRSLSKAGSGVKWQSLWAWEDSTYLAQRHKVTAFVMLYHKDSRGYLQQSFVNQLCGS